MAWCDYLEVATVERGDFMQIEPFGKGDDASIDRLEPQRGIGGEQLSHPPVIMRRHLDDPFTAQAARADPANRIVTFEGSGDWTTREVTAPVPDDANTVAFGIFLAGPGRIELRDPELTTERLATP